MIRKMHTNRIAPMVERGYREGTKFQWVRETTINAIEAGATKIEFGVEWQAVNAKGVYRRMIADNGKGMTPEELGEFFRIASAAAARRSATSTRTSASGLRPRSCPGTIMASL